MEIRLGKKISNKEIAEYLANQPTVQIIEVFKHVLSNMSYPVYAKKELTEFLLTLPDFKEE